MHKLGGHNGVTSNDSCLTTRDNLSVLVSSHTQAKNLQITVYERENESGALNKVLARIHI